jgi:cleavage stimulation factor subunit 3
LKECGNDIDSGDIWREYIGFLGEREGVTSWEVSQQQDAIRAVYQRAVVIPLANVEMLWREYDQFENKLNKVTVSLWDSRAGGLPHSSGTDTIRNQNSLSLFLPPIPPPPPPLQLSSLRTTLCGNLCWSRVWIEKKSQLLGVHHFEKTIA